MGTRIIDWFERNHLVITAPLIIFGVLIATYVITRLSGMLIHWLVRRIALRSLSGRASGPWRTRARRIGLESSEISEQRRRLRVDAASRMINHVLSVLIWITAIIVLFNLFDINAAFYLTSAGFIGAALAFGGQHKVNDYLTGLSVLFEDRYGVGDIIEFPLGDESPVRAVVDNIGLFSTRLRDAESTLHVANAALGEVRNLSQEPASATLRIHAPGQKPEQVVEKIRDLAGTADLTRVVFLGDLEGHQPSTGEVEIDVQTLKPLDPESAARLVRRVEAAFEATPDERHEPDAADR